MLLFAVAFGLSTDYGVFLLGRIKEAARPGRCPIAEAVALGLAAHGPDRHVRRAADGDRDRLLRDLAASSSSSSSAFGTAVAVLIDATIVRAAARARADAAAGRLELVGAASVGAPVPARRLRGLTEIGYLGLGSNVGERRENLQAAIELLWAHDVGALASSSVYETEPVGEVLDQRAFFNACVRSRRSSTRRALLDACKAVERGARARGDACATGRGRSTSTCCCSRSSSTRRSGSRSRTAR